MLTYEAMAGIMAEGIRYAYSTNPKLVLDGVSFVVPPGKIVGLLGSNGAGKTTLTRLLSTVLPMQAGICRVAGHDCARESLQVRKSIAVIPQGSTLNLELDVAQNMLTYLLLHGLPRREAELRIAAMADRFGLAEYLKRNCQELSGGFRRRVQVARVLATDAKCLLLDEASVGLDPVSRRELWSIVRGFAGERTVLMTTQNLQDADICDSLLFLRDGRIAAEGTPEQLKALHGPTRLAVTLDRPMTAAADLVESLSQVGASLVKKSGDKLTVELTGGAADLAGTAIKIMYAHGLPITQTAVTPPTLEDVFIALTGR